ncbi:putative lipase [Mycolicibacterium anyangense]|uniref:Putative lipase n=1 Tax=Mycolicibacterium anyangense TaxID=1431246 RepID=A0A6N4W3Q0_9MYCO|nr:lipase family protein [Mycolicibacterium anyangense]BBZ75198.1 putative lipase [Mycolicibacterium anyangense]
MNQTKWWLMPIWLTAMLTLVSCSALPHPPAPAHPEVGALAIPGDFTGSGPGTLKSAATLPTIDRRITAVSATAARITYTSESGIDGSSQLVSGTVFVPRGTPPQGGWPVVAFGHGSTGVQHDCAPSLSPTLLGTSEVVVPLVKAGYVVTVTDFQGLGLDGTYHPYLDAGTEGRNLIDSVRAARKLVPGTSTRWVAFGGSQGGQAAWAANELAAGYGSGLDLLGSVSLVPATDLTGLADAAAAGTLTADQGPLLQWILYALAEENPQLNLDDYRRGIVAQNWAVLSSCSPDTAGQRAQVAQRITADDLRPATPAATDALRGYLARMSVPQQRSSAPMLVIYGGRDNLISAAWTKQALDKTCAMGSTVEYYLQPDKGHGDIDAAVAFDWIHQRFDGDTPLNACPPRATDQTPGQARQ